MLNKMKILESTHQETGAAIKCFEDKIRFAKTARQSFFAEWSVQKTHNGAIETARFYDRYCDIFEDEAYAAFEDMLAAAGAEFKIKEFAEAALQYGDLP
jgi:hypothetical protein